MMGYGYDGGGVWMWVFGGLMMVGVLLLIGPSTPERVAGRKLG